MCVQFCLWVTVGKTCHLLGIHISFGKPPTATNMAVDTKNDIQIPSVLYCIEKNCDTRRVKSGSCVVRFSPFPDKMSGNRWHVKTKCKLGVVAHASNQKWTYLIHYTVKWLMPIAPFSWSTGHRPQSSDLSFPLQLSPCQLAQFDVCLDITVSGVLGPACNSCALWAPSKGQRAHLVLLVLSLVIQAEIYWIGFYLNPECVADASV